jgi:PKD repeat protein
VHFTDSSQGVNISSWLWDFGDGDSAFVQNPVHIFTSGGQFTVTLIVSAGNNCVASISHTVQVIQSPNAAFTNNNVCDGLPVSFMDISTAGPITGWVWDFGDGDSSFVQIRYTHIHRLVHTRLFYL